MILARTTPVVANTPVASLVASSASTNSSTAVRYGPWPAAVKTLSVTVLGDTRKEPPFWLCEWFFVKSDSAFRARENKIIARDAIRREMAEIPAVNTNPQRGLLVAHRESVGHRERASAYWSANH